MSPAVSGETGALCAFFFTSSSSFLYFFFLSTSSSSSTRHKDVVPMFTSLFYVNVLVITFVTVAPPGISALSRLLELNEDFIVPKILIFFECNIGSALS